MGKVRELQSQNDHMSVHWMPSSEVVGKETTETHRVPKEHGET